MTLFGLQDRESWLCGVEDSIVSFLGNMNKLKIQLLVNNT